MVPQGGSFPPPPPPSLPGIHLEASFRGACSGNVTRTSGRPFPGHDDPHRGAGEPFRGFPFGKVRSPVRGFLRIGEGARRCDFRSPQARGFCHKAEQGGHAFSGAGERGACERKRAGMPFSRPQGMRQLSLIVRDRARLMRRALHVHGRDGARAQHTQAPIVSFSKRRTKKVRALLRPGPLISAHAGCSGTGLIRRVRRVPRPRASFQARSSTAG